MAMDSSRPFPLIRNKTLNIGALICKKDGTEKELAADREKESAEKKDAGEKKTKEKGGDRKEKNKDRQKLDFATVQVHVSYTHLDVNKRQGVI